MRCPQGVVGAFALSFALTAGCSDTEGTGGHGGVEGNCWLGAAGGAGQLQPGLHVSGDDEGYPVEDPNEACFYVNENCSGLAPSEKCDAGGDGREPQYMGVQWTNGVVTAAPNPEAIGEQCDSQSIAVTAEMATEIPIGERGFTFTWTDDDGATWYLSGDYSTSQAYMRATRLEPDGTACSAFDIVFEEPWIRVGPY